MCFLLGEYDNGVCLNHRCQDARSLAPRGDDGVARFIFFQDAPEKIAEALFLCELLVHDGLHRFPEDAMVSRHLEDRRPYVLLERHHGGDGISGQAEEELSPFGAEDHGFARSFRHAGEMNGDAEFL